jgi:hypothetical protein
LPTTILLAARRSRAGLGLTPTDSLAERFGLFVIIVLGEVVIGVVDGLSAAGRDATTILTGMLALWSFRRRSWSSCVAASPGRGCLSPTPWRGRHPPGCSASTATS